MIGVPALVVEVATLDGTAAVASAMVAVVGPGDLLVLGGPLGAGKTAFTKAMAAAAGVDEVVTSPTFTLVRTYPTSRGWDLVHADLYRIDHLREAVDLGLPELLDDGAVGVVEWGQRALPALLPDHLLLEIEPAGAGARRIVVTPVGAAWSSRLATVRAALGAAGVTVEELTVEEDGPAGADRAGA